MDRLERRQRDDPMKKRMKRTIVILAVWLLAANLAAAGVLV